MKKSRPKKYAKLKKHSSLLSRGSVAILLGGTVVLSLTVIFAGFVGSSKGVAASSNPQVDNKRYKATRALVIDRQTGQLRMPTSEEIDEALASLATLSKRPTETSGNPEKSAPEPGWQDGINGQFVTIPTASLRRADGLAIIAQLGGGVTANLGVDLTIRAGADANGRARVFAPFPVASGSSISHYDSNASRNLLMEPAINGDLTHNVKAPDDLTFELLRDIGWTFLDADGDGVADDEDCNPNSDVRPTIVLCDVNSRVANTVFENGCSMADLITQLAAAANNHDEFLTAVANLTNEWVEAGLITGRQKGAIQRAAARCP